MSGAPPSGPGTPDDAGRDLLAAEYVLGTLEAREAAGLRAALAADPALAAAVAGWEARLAPLLDLAPPLPPPPGLWARIDAALDAAGTGAETGAAPAPGPRVVPFPAALAPARVAAGWRAFGLGSAAVAAGLALLLVAGPPAPDAGGRLATVLLADRDQPAWLVEAEGGAIRLAALNPRGLEPGRAMQLWALPRGAAAPTSLGLIPPEGRVTVVPAGLSPEAGMLIEISLEPPGGSPTGRPTGPILFIGRLTPARES